MKAINDAIGLLNSSKNMLIELKSLYSEAIYDDELSFDFKLKIKYFLENIRSCLDYTANYIFITHCSNNYTDKELKKIKIYFPIFDDKPYFEKNIRNRFKGLSLKDPIVITWNNYQLYNGVEWPKKLAKLTNKNKHIELIKNSRTESGIIKHMELANGTTISNCISINSGHVFETPSGPVSLKNLNSNPLIKSYDGNIKAEYFFVETNTPVIETLEEILIGAKNLIAELEKEL